jgi:hypothetical protein
LEGDQVTVWSDYDSGRVVALFFFCFGLPIALLPLDYQWVYASNKLLHQVSCNWEEWRSQETHLVEIVSACITLTKSWSNCPWLFKFQQINFIETIDTPDIPQKDIPPVFFDRSKSVSPN